VIRKSTKRLIQSVSAACGELLSLRRLGPASAHASTWWR
jgi:hypothetical protein